MSESAWRLLIEGLATVGTLVATGFAWRAAVHARRAAEANAQVARIMADSEADRQQREALGAESITLISARRPAG
jgi:hypothetical protein